MGKCSLPRFARSVELTEPVAACERGTVMVESVFALSFTLAIILACFDLLNLVYHYGASSYIANETARWASYGGTFDSLDRVQSIKAKARSLSSKLAIGINESGLKVCPLELPDCEVDSAAGPEQFLILSMTVPVRVLALGGLQLQLHIESAVSNEPF